MILVLETAPPQKNDFIKANFAHNAPYPNFPASQRIHTFLQQTSDLSISPSV